MFGLGWMEMLVIGGAISLIFGPIALRRLVATAREVTEVKSNLTGPRMLDRWLGDDPAEERERPADDDV